MKRRPQRALVIFSAVCISLAPTVHTALANQGSDAPKAKAADHVQAKGRVLDRDGKGIPNAEVTFTGPTKTKATTDLDGSFNREVTAGKYKILAKAGSKSKGIDADIQSDSPALLLVLEQ